MLGLATVTDAEPLRDAQTASIELLVTDGPLDAPTETLAVAEHPLLLTVTVYVPAANPVTVAVLPAPPLHEYVGLTGLVTDTVAVPLFCPHDVAAEVVLSDGPLDADTDTLAVALHPLLSTVTV